MLLTKIKKELPSFRQSRYRFYEDHDELVKVVEVQFLNLGNDRKAFTIHLGFYVPKIYEVMWGQDKPREIEASICILFLNVNWVLSDFKGKPRIKYWDLENLEQLFQEIQKLVREVIFPFNLRINSLNELNSFMNVTDYPGKYVAAFPLFRFALKRMLGKEDEIAELVAGLKLSNSNSYDVEIVELDAKLKRLGY